MHIYSILVFIALLSSNSAEARPSKRNVFDAFADNHPGSDNKLFNNLKYLANNSHRLQEKLSRNQDNLKLKLCSTITNSIDCMVPANFSLTSLSRNKTLLAQFSNDNCSKNVADSGLSTYYRYFSFAKILLLNVQQNLGNTIIDSELNATLESLFQISKLLSCNLNQFMMSNIPVCLIPIDVRYKCNISLTLLSKVLQLLKIDLQSSK
ncbi:hypothetical protein TrispH2_001568 [Trichoplax sp. H2]|nr:hypothetical protein TrispH2_001568 [Trichoplax sp. H2]|eukprot:RDD47046.1 hypothetical protein TrispH2_001568 [Trichoplax sp. H2]